MTYRDDHEAALMRVDAAERELARLAEDNARLVGERDRARQWLGAPAGVLVAEGPELSGWTLVATQCVDVGPEVQIRKQGDELDMLWLSRSAVEIESALFDARLDAEACAEFRYDLTWTPDGYRGYLAVDCKLGPNRVHGRIAFTRCS